MPTYPLVDPAPPRPLRVGVIGIGNMGQHHVRIFHGLPDVRLVGICDIQRDRGCQQAQQYGVHYFPHYQALLPHVDAVSIAVPTSLHHEIGLACLRSHCHIFLEKPIASSVAEADSLISEAQNTQCILQVGHIEQFNPAFLALKHHWGNHPIVHLTAERMSPWLDRGCDVSVVMDLMIHDLDLMSVLAASPVLSITAQGHYLESGYLGAASATLQFANGITGSLTASKISSRKRRCFSIQGQTLSIEANLLNRDIQIQPFPQSHQTTDLDISSISEAKTTALYPQNPLQAEFEDFVKCIYNHQCPRVGGQQALAALHVATLAEEYIRKTI